LVVGFADGFIGIWDRSGGERLFGRRLHGPVTRLLIEGERLHAISALGRATTLSLHALHRRYCSLLRELWQEIPVIWRRGSAAVVPPPQGHRCAGVTKR
jgi:hypothetical protein